jgi:carbonic anhydrase
MKTPLSLLLIALMFSCNSATTNKTADNASNGNKSATDNAMTADEQKALSPDTVVSKLKSGNKVFYSYKELQKNDSLRIKQTEGGQYPMAAILSCIDSRVPVEEVFDEGLGDLFVARVAGNIANEDILGSLEYACNVAGSKVILVLGHDHCGGIKAAVDNVQTGNIAALVAKIKPAVDAVKVDGPRSSKNDELVHAVAVKNVELTVKYIREHSPILNKMEQDKKIKIIGGLYDLESGKITFY